MQNRKCGQIPLLINLNGGIVFCQPWFQVTFFLMYYFSFVMAYVVFIALQNNIRICFSVYIIGIIICIYFFIIICYNINRNRLEVST